MDNVVDAAMENPVESVETGNDVTPTTSDEADPNERVASGTATNSDKMTGSASNSHKKDWTSRKRKGKPQIQLGHALFRKCVVFQQQERNNRLASLPLKKKVEEAPTASMTGMESLSNELIVDILQRLSFRELWALRNTSTRLNNMVNTYRSKEFPQWKINTKSESWDAETSYLVTNDTVVIGSGYRETSKIDFYEYSDQSKHFYRTHRRAPQPLKMFPNQKECMIPGTSIIVMTSVNPNGGKFNVFDLGNEMRWYCMCQLPGAVLSLSCSTRAIVMTIQPLGQEKLYTLAYKWDGSMASQDLTFYIGKGESLESTPMPQLSENGIIAFWPDDEDEALVCLYKVHEHTGLGYINFGYMFDDIRINGDGTRVMISHRASGHHALYDVATRTKLFEMENTQAQRLKAFSPDFRFMLFEHHILPVPYLVQLTVDWMGRLKYDSGMFLMCPPVEVAIFRKIHGVQHLQIIDRRTGHLRLIKYENGQWNALVE